jgi:hypothetical protein
VIIKYVYSKGLEEFRFYYAKILLEGTISSETDIFQKIKYLVKGLNQYDKYLLGKSMVKISNVNQIVSKIMSDSTANGFDSINKICNAFDNDDNKLEPVSILKGLLTNTKPEEFLVNYTFGATIQTWGGVITAVISEVAAVAAVLALKPFHLT